MHSHKTLDPYHSRSGFSRDRFRWRTLLGDYLEEKEGRIGAPLENAME